MTKNYINKSLYHIAESYVQLVLSVGLYDDNYVDAYIGDPRVLKQVQIEKKPLDEIKKDAETYIEELRAMEMETMEEIIQLRHSRLLRHMQSLVTRVEILGGREMSFEDEAKALYDAEPPRYPEKHFQKIVMDIDNMLPGKGSVTDRYNEFKKEFIIPKEKLDAVFQAVIRECRRRTKEHLELPENESFVVEYVNDKPWEGYNWYKGGGLSLIQVNTDLPVHIDRAVDLAAHEGYPGHHVYSSLLESDMYRRRGWAEFSVYPLFSPQSLIMEGMANFGIEVVFPGDELMKFMKNVLFPIAGMDESRVEIFYNIHSCARKLVYALNEATRGYLNGVMTRDEAVAWIVRYALQSPDRAQMSTRFFDKYRSYIINYYLGQDLVRNYIHRRGGTANRPRKRWEEFKKLISSPMLPSGLR